MQHEVKSQDDMNRIEQHSTDVLIKAIEECEKLKKENQEYHAALMSIEYHTAALSGCKRDMENALLIISSISRQVLEMFHE